MAKKDKQINIDLASKYNTTPQRIAYIRSCFFNLHLSREDMALRQQHKIKLAEDMMLVYKKAIERRYKLIKRYPQSAEALERKIKATEFALAKIPLHIEDRQLTHSFIMGLSDEEYLDITKMT